jgi:hypothetical protein
MKRHIYISCWSICLVSILLTSCFSNPKHPAELASADSLCKVLTPLDSLFRKTDSTEVKKIYAEVDNNLAYVQFNNKDSLTQDAGLLLSRYYNAKIILGVYVKLGGDLFRKIKEEKIRCTDLAHDLRHNTLKETLDPRMCVDSEKSHVASLAMSVSALRPELDRSLSTYKELNPKMITWMAALKSKGGVEPPADRDKKHPGEDND